MSDLSDAEKAILLRVIHSDEVHSKERVEYCITLCMLLGVELQVPSHEGDRWYIEKCPALPDFRDNDRANHPVHLANKRREDYFGFKTMEAACCGWVEWYECLQTKDGAEAPAAKEEPMGQPLAKAIDKLLQTCKAEDT